MPTPKLSLSMIVKNEEKTLPRLLRSVAQYVDEIVIVDTGSTDKTKEVAAAFGAKVTDCNPATHPQFFFHDTAEFWAAWPEGERPPGPYSGEYCLGNFGEARNVSHRLATGDFIMWLDADDVLQGGENLRNLVMFMAMNNLETSWMLYDYGQDDKGRTNCRLWRERIVKRGTAQWMNPIHEVMGPIKQHLAFKAEHVSVKHQRPPERSATVAHRNYKVLLQHRAALEDARTLFYFGNEARFINPDQAVVAYERYVEISGWPEERAIARAYLGELYEMRADRLENVEGGPTPAQKLEAQRALGKSFFAYSGATTDFAALPDGWFGLARLAYRKNEWADCVRYSEEGIKRGNPDSVIMVNPLARTYAPFLVYNLALNALGRVQEALDACNKGLAAVAEDPQLLFNKGIYEKFLADKANPVNQALASAIVPQKVKNAIVRALSESGPRLVRPASADKLSIVLWTGPSVEPWSPSSPNTTGIGGSETAAIEMAKHFAAMGHTVVSYSDVPFPTGEGVFDGVEYRHHGEFTGVDCDVFISSRQPHVMQYPVTARAKFLWVHDVHVGQPGPQMHEFLLKFDRYLCLSEWHRAFFLQVYPHIHPSEVLVTRNGIDPARFLGDLPPRKNKLIYSSSANRGLDVLLDLFPRIQTAVPDAELHVFYGFESWEHTARLTGNAADLTQIEMYKFRLANTPGVVMRGRVDQKTLAREMMEAKVWAYPTAFTETYCITAIEAQAAGCIPVATHLAGLIDTVKWGVRIDGQNTDPVYQGIFVSQVVEMLRNEEKRQTVAELAREWALGLTWEALAKEWSGLFERTIAEVEEAKVPRYEGMVSKAPLAA